MSEQDAGSQNGSNDSSNDSLNGSWVKLDESFKNGNEHPFSIHNGEMERLLAEAVGEDRAVATHSHRQSFSPVPSEERGTEATRPETDKRVSPPENVANDPSWIENWASRVEPHPPKKWRLTYPPHKDIRKNKKICATESKTDAFQMNFYIIIPTLVFTHIVAFGIGFYIGRRSSSGTVLV